MKEKIRVLHTEWSDGWGGQEIRIINEMLAIRERGIEVFLACRNHAVIKQKALENNIKVFILPFRGNIDLKTLFSLKRLIKENDIDIINTHSGKDTWVGGLAAKLAGIKFIRTRHLSNQIRSSRTNFINELADYIMTTGESVRVNMIQDNRINPARILSVPTGIDTSIFNPEDCSLNNSRQLFNVDKGQIVIGVVAVLRRFKRHDRFLRMVRHVIDNNPKKKIHALIAGDGPQKDNIISIINDLELNDNVSILGHVDNVPELLCALDIFILSSDSGEGVPQSIMQALLMQVPVIATNSGSTVDLYNGDNFLLIDKEDQVQLNNACDSLLNDKYLRNLLSSNSRKYIVDNFSKVKMTEKILNIYRSILE